MGSEIEENSSYIDAGKRDYYAFPHEHAAVLDHRRIYDIHYNGVAE